MRIRDSHATITGDKTEYVIPSDSLDIIADGGRTLFSIGLNDDLSIRVNGGNVCKCGELLLDDKIQIHPRATNLVHISKPQINTKQTDHL